MPKAFDSWTVLPHGPFERLANNVWRLEGSLPNMPLKRVMTVARRDDGRVVIHNAIAVGDPEREQIEALGPLAFLIVPNAYHRLDARAYVSRYPDLQVLCPSGGKTKVEEVVKVSGTFAEFPKDPAVEIEHLEGVKEGEGVMTVRSEDGVTLVFTDILFNMPDGKGFAGFVFKHITASTGGPRISRIARLMIIKDRTKLRAHLERLAKTEGLRRIVVAHHELISSRPGEVLAEVATTI